MAQVGDDRDDLEARFMGRDLELRRHREVQRNGRQSRPQPSVKASTTPFGNMVILLPGR
jgi:hypothetical protein